MLRWLAARTVDQRYSPSEVVATALQRSGGHFDLALLRDKVNIPFFKIYSGVEWGSQTDLIQYEGAIRQHEGPEF